MKKKTSNPLSKRVLKELIGEWQKYLVIALFMILMIGFISGMFVANKSMLTSIDEKVVSNKLEDGCFELDKEADAEFISAVESGDKADVKEYYLNKGYEEADAEVVKAVNEQFPEITDELLESEMYQQILSEAKEEAHKEVDKAVDEAYEKAVDRYDLENPDYKSRTVEIFENFYKDSTEDRNFDGEKEGNIRVFKDRDDVDLYSILKGEMPDADNEIAIDRMHADNVDLKVGDEISVGGEKFKITALIALVNYSTLYEKPTDSMFDAINFNVAIVTDAGFDRIEANIHYNYAWIYESKPEGNVEKKAYAENVMTSIVTNSVVGEYNVENFLPAYLNEAINFALDDLGQDMVMATIILYILIAVIAFIFAITVSSTINKEASVIGTLRASGYTKGELVVHYMSMPVLVTLISAVIGNILGYTFFKTTVVNMYYNSYSLPAYETVWSPDAFIYTTVIPIVLMFIVNLVIIVRNLRYSPLRFLRHDLKRSKKKKTMRLPRWSFFKRFRLRIMFQNIPNYLVLLFGISFVMLMLSMAVGFPQSVKAYQSNVQDLIFADYQTILKTTEDDDGNTIATSEESAERFTMAALEYRAKTRDESISVYGIVDDSKYITLADGLNENEVMISNTFSEKYKIYEGDTFVLNEKYDNKSYSFKVKKVYDYKGSLSVFMPIESLNELLEKDADYFSGFMSKEELTDIDYKYIATTLTVDDVLKISRQLDHSMGAYMQYFQYLCIILSAVLIYLLTKIIIEKNENSISMVKILGYTNKEISSLYMTISTIAVIVSCIVGELIGYFAMNAAFKWFLSTMEGWFTFVITPLGFLKMFAFGFIGYLLVMSLDYRRIKKIPMDQALKNVE